MKKYVKYLLISFVFITITSKLSPIYPVNDWVDTNAFFTMGKAMMRGFTIYKDLFEQKGPLLYLIYGIGYLISNKSFFGVYLLEVLSFSIFLKYVHLILDLLECKNQKFLLIVISFFITISPSFSGGGSAEEFCFPFIAYNFLMILRIIKDKDINSKQIFLNGLFCGCVFIIKFNLVSFWIPFVLFIFRRDNKFKNCIIFFCSCILPFLFSLLYFFLKNGVYEYIDVYFFKNFFGYNKGSFNLENIYNILLSNDYVLFFLIIVFFIYAFKERMLNFYFIIFVIPFYFICCQNIYMIYYSIPFYIIMIPIFVFVFDRINFKKWYLFLIIFLTFLFGKNTYMLKYQSSDFVQYKFSQIINNYDDKSLLNYNLLDAGFYLKSNIVPNVRFFESQNFSFDEMISSLKGYVDTKSVNFVVFVSQENDFKFADNIVKKKYKLLAVDRNIKDRGMYYALYVRK